MSSTLKRFLEVKNTKRLRSQEIKPETIHLSILLYLKKLRVRIKEQKLSPTLR